MFGGIPGIVKAHISKSSRGFKLIYKRALTYFGKTRHTYLCELWITICLLRISKRLLPFYSGPTSKGSLRQCMPRHNCEKTEETSMCIDQDQSIFSTTIRRTRFPHENGGASCRHNRCGTSAPLSCRASWKSKRL